jgi:hypothetical protein
MEERPDPTESVQETIRHAAERATEPWILRVAVSTALYAALAAVTSLLAGRESHNAILQQVQASDHWAWYHSERLQDTVLESKDEVLTALGHPAGPGDRSNLGHYEEKSREIRSKADELVRSSRRHFHRHGYLALSSTFLHVAIAVAAIAILAGRKEFWYGSILLAVIGAVVVVYGFVSLP